MPSEITRIEVPEPEPMHPTPDGGAETQGVAYRLSAPAVATEPLTVTAPDGTVLTWVPTELCYRDESGHMDYIVGSAPASVQVRDREARYKRTFPVADDVFRAEAERVKHWVILHEPPRAPAEYLSGQIEFCVTGLVSGVTLPEGRHDKIEAGPFRLPKPVARDLAGKEIEGYYEVLSAEGGQQLFVWFPADAILRAVYPVTIDPTITTHVYDVLTSVGDDGIARAPDGSYYILVNKGGGGLNPPYWWVYRSQDGGQTWVDTAFPGSSTNPYGNELGSICATDDGLIHVVVRDTNGFHHRYYDGQAWSPSKLAASTRYSPQKVAIAGGPDGTIHMAYVTYDSNTSQYSLHYAKFASGSWSSPTTLITLSYSITPSIAVSGQTVVVAYQYGISLTTDYVGSRVSKNGGSSFSGYTIEVSDSRSPHVFVDGDGAIHVVYTRLPSSILRRQWTGSGWSTAETVATVTSPGGPKGVASGTDLIVLWSNDDGSGIPQVRYRARRGGVWGSISTLAPSPAQQIGVVVPQSAPATDFPVAWTEGNESPYILRCEMVDLADAPDAPILGARANFDATEDAVFAWTFSDPDAGDTQSAYQLLIKRASDSVTVYDTGKVASSAEQHTVPGGTLSNGVQYRWTVRTWDSLDQAGPYATEQSFLTSAKPSVTITDPASDGAVIGTSSYTIQWSMSDPESKGQSAYQVVLRDSGGNVVHDSGKVQSTTARAYTLHNLQNNTTYTVQLTVWDGDGVASDVATRTFQVQYTPPPTPDVTVEALDGRTRITIANHNAGAEIQAISNDVYRRRAGESGNGLRIATGVAPDGVIEDYAVASGVAYEYRVVAIGGNGTTAASAWTPAPILSLRGAWLHDPADPAGTVRSYRVAVQPERGEDWEPERALLQFAGRALPVAEFGEHEDRLVQCTILILPDRLDDLDALRALGARRSVVCYRDSAGRRIFGVLGPLRIRDERHGGYTVDLEITAVDYDEAV